MLYENSSICFENRALRSKPRMTRRPLREAVRGFLASLYAVGFRASLFVPVSTIESILGLLFPGVDGGEPGAEAGPATRLITASFGQGDRGIVRSVRGLTRAELFKLLATETRAPIDHKAYMALDHKGRNAEKANDPFVVFGVFRGNKRNKVSLESRSAATLDIDDDAAELFKRLEDADKEKRGVVPFSYAYHTTRSHTPERPRLRLVVTFSRDIAPQEYGPCVRALVARFGIPRIDMSCVDEPERVMYLPVTNAGTTLYGGEWEGVGDVDPDTLLAEAADMLYAPTADAKPETAKVLPLKPVGGAVATAGAGDTERTFFRRVNDAAMGDFAAWVPVIWPEAKPYHGGFRVSSELLGRNLEEDISITPEGIVDFGVGDMGDPHEGKRTPISLVLEHVDRRDQPHDARSAAFWLCDQLGVAPESMGWVAKDYPYVGEKGQILARLENVVIGLRNPREGDVPHIGYDDALADIVVNDGGARSLTDNDYSIWQIALERRGFNAIPRETMRSAVEVVAHENKFDSLKEWANSLKWDGVGRVASFAHTHLGVSLNAYHQAVSFYLWTALAGRAVEPGIKADYVPVLVGKEGTGKTQTVEALAPNPRFFASIDMQAKQDDLARKTRGVVVAEWSEMRGAKTRDEEAIKDFVTRREENHTPKFKERNVRYLRRFVIIGTTNDMGVLPAYGDARRWFPLEIAENINIEAIKHDREQLWAEGVHYFKHFGIMWQDADAASRTVRDDFREEDPMRAPVVAWLGQPVSQDAPLDAQAAKTNGETEFAIADLQTALEAQRLRPVPQRLGLLLRALGYEIFRKRQGHHWLRLWRKQ